MRITVNNDKFLATETPLMSQLRALGAKFTLTCNDPYPCFMVTVWSNIFLFTENGEDVNTMMGTFKSFGFKEVKDVREVIPNLHWKEGWE